MKTKFFVMFLMGAWFFAPLAFCQEKGQVEQAAPEIAVETENISWVWGEVKSIDTATASLNVMYMDYQTDEEKELFLNTDLETKLEGVSDFSAVKAGDTASIDYVIKDGKNIARNISIEKIEVLPEAPVEPEDFTPEMTQEQKTE